LAQVEKMATMEDSQLPQGAQLPPARTESRQVVQPTGVILREIVETLLLTLFIFWIVNTATGRYRVQGHSMMPTLKEGEYLIINKLSYFLEDPQRGDIVVLHYPRDRNREYIKRIIGLPGDRVEVGNGQVKVNGVVLNEPYINGMPAYQEQTWVVPEDSFFVLGDNRNNSSDSRNWSFLPRSDIVGKASVIYWGVEDWGLVPHFPHLTGQDPITG
jgi:signal peptidase I